VLDSKVARADDVEKVTRDQDQIGLYLCRLGQCPSKRVEDVGLPSVHP